MLCIHKNAYLIKGETLTNESVISQKIAKFVVINFQKELRLSKQEVEREEISRRNLLYQSLGVIQSRRFGQSFKHLEKVNISKEIKIKT